MKTQRLFIGLFATTLLAGAASLAYFVSLSTEERWVFVMGGKAEAYANAALAGDASIQKKYADEFIDYVIITNSANKTVLFSAHEDGHNSVLVFAPRETSEVFPIEGMRARRIRGPWYRGT